MIGFHYNYKTHEEIFTALPRILEMSFLEILFVLLGVIFLFICIFFLIPLCIIWKKEYLLRKKKEEKKKLLTQILLQKEIEDEVEKEIQIEDEGKVIQ